jgi:hypothetical protein
VVLKDGVDPGHLLGFEQLVHLLHQYIITVRQVSNRFRNIARVNE